MQEGTSQNWRDEQASSSGVAIPPEEVEAELQRILASPTFRKAPRHCRFLSFVVWKALSGEGETVKEYLIGLEVFDRPSDYDPGSDPIVRAEARRLRTRLADYYKKLGKSDPIHIDLPKGTYVPVFQRNGATPVDAVVPPRLLSRRWWFWWALAAALLCVASWYGVRLFRPKKSIPKAPVDVVIADFTNTTGDAIFDLT